MVVAFAGMAEARQIKDRDMAMCAALKLMCSPSSGISNSVEQPSRQDKKTEASLAGLA
jgi:hypothetical protein